MATNNSLPKIQTKKGDRDEICHDDSAPPVRATTVDELHSLQKKKTSVPTTPKVAADDDRSTQQLQSIRYSIFPPFNLISPNLDPFLFI